MLEASIRKIYAEFFGIFKEQLVSGHATQLVPFVAAKGKDYSAQPMRLLLVGRAVNGWTSFDAHPNDDGQSFGEKALLEYRKDIFADWLELKDGTLWSKHSADYSLNKSAFWRTARAIWSELSGSAPEGRWVDNIAWSNLYKISPKASGNPSNRLCAQQAELCRDLLAKEITAFAPTHILLATGWDGWFFHKKNVYDFSQLFTEVRKNSEQHKHIEGAAFFLLPDGRKIPAVVTCRQDNPRKIKSEKLFVQNVINAFKELAASL